MHVRMAEADKKKAADEARGPVGSPETGVMACVAACMYVDAGKRSTLPNYLLYSDCTSNSFDSSGVLCPVALSCIHG